MLKLKINYSRTVIIGKFPAWLHDNSLSSSSSTYQGASSNQITIKNTCIKLIKFRSLHRSGNRHRWAGGACQWLRQNKPYDRHGQQIRMDLEWMAEPSWGGCGGDGPALTKLRSFGSKSRAVTKRIMACITSIIARVGENTQQCVNECTCGA